MGGVVLALAFLAVSAWSCLALWHQTGGDGLWRLAAVVAWAALLVFLAWLAWRRTRLGLILIVAAFAAFGAWWLSIEPRLDRDWAPDVARTVTGRVDGDVVTLENVRDFAWRDAAHAEERWKTERYDLSQLTETDVILSYWGMEAIAHTLVSFGFSDGRRVVFSIEIRREKNEEFSSVAGFFKTYELALIAAEERDILYLRTNARGERTYLYPLRLPKPAAAALFRTYVETGNALARNPEFYNTLTANCTTVAFDLARLIEPGIPSDWRILLSGYLPGYLADQGVLLWNMPLDSLRRRAEISTRAKAAPPGADYSEAIRREP
ncbi:DUF4105 domain-containing protein [Hansschlegelia beijingensis]|uniref:Lnb N-terminal periplasmic domain-containing protein n=1 Tax=Hansschlegelia beijingensis TaxID=1133344 RepID=UPI00387EEEB0